MQMFYKCRIYRKKFVSKPIVENIHTSKHWIQQLNDITAESDAIAMQQLRAYVITESADANFLL